MGLLVWGLKWMTWPTTTTACVQIAWNLNLAVQIERKRLKFGRLTKTTAEFGKVSMICKSNALGVAAMS